MFSRKSVLTLGLIVLSLLPQMSFAQATQDPSDPSFCAVTGQSTGMWDDGGPLIGAKYEGKFITLNPFDVAVFFRMERTIDNAIKAAKKVYGNKALVISVKKSLAGGKGITIVSAS